MGEGPGAILSFETFFSFINIQLKTNRGVLFLPPSDAYVRSFLYLLYTLIKLYYTKALSNQALSLAPGGEEFNPGPETRLDRSELWCNKVLLKCKGDRESF